MEQPKTGTKLSKPIRSKNYYPTTRKCRKNKLC